MAFTCGSVSYADPFGTWVGEAGQYAHKWMPGDVVIERESLFLPGVNGTAFRRNGFRVSRFTLWVWYVRLSAQELAQDIQADLKTLADAPVEVNGIPACYLMQGSGQTGPCMPGALGCVFAMVQLNFEQRRLS